MTLVLPERESSLHPHIRISLCINARDPSPAWRWPLQPPPSKISAIGPRLAGAPCPRAPGGESVMNALVPAARGGLPVGWLLAGPRGVGKQCHLACVLDRAGHVALLAGGEPGDAPAADLAAVGDEPAQQRGVLVVDVGDARRVERVRAVLEVLAAGGWLGHRDLISPTVSTSLTCGRRVADRRARGGGR